MRQGTTIREATQDWVSSFNAFPYSMIETLMKHDIDSWHEVTKPRIGDRVYVFEFPEGYDGNEHSGTIEKLVGDVFLIELDDETTIEIGSEDFEVERDTLLPMWGTLWQFGDSADDYWAEDLDGIQSLSNCGFRVYEHEEWGYFFGIDGCGYSFFEEHWIPLYKARGLRWHDEKAEKEYQMLQKGYTKGKLGMKEYWFDGDKAIEEVCV